MRYLSVSGRAACVRRAPLTLIKYINYHGLNSRQNYIQVILFCQ